jgi:hypothetical protein
MNEYETKVFWGVCPVCRDNDGYLNVGRNHWFFCREHKTKWCVGSNLFSGWRRQTEAEQQFWCEKLNFGSYEEVHPYLPKCSNYYCDSNAWRFHNGEWYCQDHYEVATEFIPRAKNVTRGVT